MRRLVFAGLGVVAILAAADLGGRLVLGRSLVALASNDDVCKGPLAIRVE